MADVLARVDPFSARVAALPAGSGDVVVADRSGLAIATLMARDRERLAARIRSVGDAELPDGPSATFTGGLTLVATGPESWLAVREGAPAGWAGALGAALGEAAAVVDQSSAYALLGLGGPGAARLLGRGAFIDLHPDAFPPGSAAATLIAHIGVILWRRDAGYETAVFRSLAGSYWHWLETAAAGFGARLSR